MKEKGWKIVWLVGVVIFAVGVIMSSVVHFQHWDEIISKKQMFMYQLPAICVLIPGWLILTIGIFRK